MSSSSASSASSGKKTPSTPSGARSSAKPPASSSSKKDSKQQENEQHSKAAAVDYFPNLPDKALYETMDPRFSTEMTEEQVMRYLLEEDPFDSSYDEKKLDKLDPVIFLKNIQRFQRAQNSVNQQLSQVVFEHYSDFST